MKALQVLNIAKSFDDIQILRGVSLDLEEGEAHAICWMQGARNRSSISSIDRLRGRYRGKSEVATPTDCG